VDQPTTEDGITEDTVAEDFVNNPVTAYIVSAPAFRDIATKTRLLKRVLESSDDEVDVLEFPATPERAKSQLNIALKKRFYAYSGACFSQCRAILKCINFQRLRLNENMVEEPVEWLLMLGKCASKFKRNMAHRHFFAAAEKAMEENDVGSPKSVSLNWADGCGNASSVYGPVLSQTEPKFMFLRSLVNWISFMAKSLISDSLPPRSSSMVNDFETFSRYISVEPLELDFLDNFGLQEDIVRFSRLAIAVLLWLHEKFPGEHRAAYRVAWIWFGLFKVTRLRDPETPCYDALENAVKTLSELTSTFSLS
jgi:hypothetical protein